MFPAVHMTHL